MLGPSAVVNQAKVVRAELARMDPEQRLVRPLLRRVRNVLTKVKPAATAKECASLDAAVGRTSSNLQKMQSAEDPSAVENRVLEVEAALVARLLLSLELIQRQVRRVLQEERPVEMEQECAEDVLEGM